MTADGAFMPLLSLFCNSREATQLNHHRGKAAKALIIKQQNYSGQPP